MTLRHRMSGSRLFEGTWRLHLEQLKDLVLGPHVWKEVVLNAFIRQAVCLTTGPQPLPQRVLYTLQSSASTFNFQYSLICFMSSIICLRLLPRLAVTLSFPLFPSITCFIRQFLHKMWPIQLTFHLFTVCRIFLSPLTLCHILHFSHDGPNWSTQSFSSATFQNFQIFQIYCPQCPSLSTTQSFAPNVAIYQFLP